MQWFTKVEETIEMITGPVSRQWVFLLEQTQQNSHRKRLIPKALPSDGQGQPSTLAFRTRNIDLCLLHRALASGVTISPMANPTATNITKYVKENVHLLDNITNFPPKK